MRALTRAKLGAPEYPGRSANPVTQAIDIWSLGCVFSLAATWIILDHAGVSQFHKVRQLAIKKYIQTQHAHDRALETSEGDHFHNGRNVLDAVTQWHKYLRNVLRETDTITSQVLDLVDEAMLLGPADRRISASDLCVKLRNILNACPKNSEPPLAEELVTLLGEVDEEASCRAASIRRSRYIAQASSASSKTITRDARKSYAVERSLKTTHRQSFWPNQSLRLHDGRYPELQTLQLHSNPERFQMASEDPHTPRQPTYHHRMPSDSTFHMTPSRSKRTRYIKKHPPQNYFQACEDILKREKGKKEYIKHALSKNPLSKKDSLKDGLLASYFDGDRDIVSIP